MKPYRMLVAAAFLSALSIAASALPQWVRAEVGDDGSVVIEGVRYKDVSPLKVELKKLEQRHADIHVWARPGMKFGPVGKAIMLLQKAGYAKIGFITGPAQH